MDAARGKLGRAVTHLHSVLLLLCGAVSLAAPCYCVRAPIVCGTIRAGVASPVGWEVCAASSGGRGGGQCTGPIGLPFCPGLSAVRENLARGRRGPPSSPSPFGPLCRRVRGDIPAIGIVLCGDAVAGGALRCCRRCSTICMSSASFPKARLYYSGVRGTPAPARITAEGGVPPHCVKPVPRRPVSSRAARRAPGITAFSTAAPRACAPRRGRSRHDAQRPEVHHRAVPPSRHDAARRVERRAELRRQQSGRDARAVCGLVCGISRQRVRLFGPRSQQCQRDGIGEQWG